MCISDNFEKLDEYILKAILKNIPEDPEKPFKEKILGCTAPR